MARARNIKPGFYKNEDLAECSVWARYIFPGLWMLADREGRLEDRPKRIKGDLLPYDGQDVEPLLAELAARKDAQGIPFIIRYQNSEGRFIQISKFLVHQSPHYSEKQSIIKPPEFQESEPDEAATTPRKPPEYSEKPPVIKRGSQPPDSLIPDSLNPSSLIADSPNPESRGKAEARATRLPLDWTLPEPWLIWTRTEKPSWPLPHVHSVADSFRDHWIAKPGKDGTKLDWEATWRNWVRREKDPRAAASSQGDDLLQRNLRAVGL